MLGRVKDYLGVEGVRLGLALVGEPQRADGIAGRGTLRAELTLSTLRAQRVTRLEVTLTEVYRWGRGDTQRIESFELGRFAEACLLDLEPGQDLVLPFELRFAERRSNVDELGARHALLRPLVGLARLGIGAASEYTLQARAKVTRVALDPVATLAVEL